eukprot:1316448-Amorphochlora_amoeboformis.AAC.1
MRQVGPQTPVGPRLAISTLDSNAWTWLDVRLSKRPILGFSRVVTWPPVRCRCARSGIICRSAAVTKGTKPAVPASVRADWMDIEMMFSLTLVCEKVGGSGDVPWLCPRLDTFTIGTMHTCLHEFLPMGWARFHRRCVNDVAVGNFVHRLKVKCCAQI